jgi:hypothetical protein
MGKRDLLTLTFLILAIFLLLRNIQLQRLNYDKSKRLNAFINFYNLDSTFWGRKLVLLNLNDYYGKTWKEQDFNSYSNMIIIFISGGCSSCFDSEIEIWNKLSDNLKNKLHSNGLVVGINIGLDDDVILYYLKKNYISFPILKDNGVYKKLLGEYINKYEVIAFLIDSNFKIIRVHFSERGNQEKTMNFARLVNKFLEEK